MTKRQWVMGICDDYQARMIFVKQDAYDPDINRVLKQELPGPCKFDKEIKAFCFPMHWDTCVNARQVANRFGAELTIGSELREWAIKEKQRREAIPDVQSMELTDLPTVRSEYPAIWEAVRSRPFQTVGAAFAAKTKSCLIADQPGLGKTIQSIGAVIEAGVKGPILVVAPKAAAKLTWPQELKRWAPEDNVVVLGAHLPPTGRKHLVAQALGFQKSEEGKSKRLWVLTSPNYVRIKTEVDEFGHYKYDKGKKIIHPVGEAVMELFDVKWSAVIVDECHQTLAGASGDPKKQSSQRRGLGALELSQDGLRIALSGTPFRGKEENFWGVLNWLRPDLFRSRWRWLEKHFDVRQDRFGMVIGHMIDRKAMYAEASNVMIRRTKEEVAKDLPPKLYNTVWLDMEGKQAESYESMKLKAQADLEDGILQTTGILAELTRLKQFAGSYGNMVDGGFKPTLPSNKFDWLLEFLDEHGIARDTQHKAPADFDFSQLPKIVVTSQFSQLINIIADALWEQGINSYKFTGATSDNNREQIKNDWQNYPDSTTRVLLLTTTAGGVSLTLDAASDLIVLDETWNPDDQEQVEDRIHRLSRMHQVTIWKVFSKGTIEESIYTNNLQSERGIKGIIDGSRGIEFAKDLL